MNCPMGIYLHFSLHLDMLSVSICSLADMYLVFSYQRNSIAKNSNYAIPKVVYLLAERVRATLEGLIFLKVTILKTCL